MYIHALIIGEHHRDQAGVRCALHVVLPAQRVEPAARLADLPGHHAERNQAARVVGAVNVLGNAHAPQNHGSLRLGEDARHFLDRFRWNAADRRHRFWTVAFDVLLEVLVANGAALDEVVVHQPFVDDGVHHGIQQRHVRVGLELQHVVRVTREFGTARIGVDKLGAALCCILDPRGGHRMV
jgi:hypothetical protein